MQITEEPDMAQTKGPKGTDRILKGLEKYDLERLGLPQNDQGKIDYANLIKALSEETKDDGDWQVRQSDRQCFYEKNRRREELTTALEILSRDLNLTARNAGVEDVDALARGRLAATSKQAKKDRDGATEARAQYAAVLAKISEANAEVTRLRRENEGLKAQLEMVRSGFLVSVK
jgi:hypothetical protein